MDRIHKKKDGYLHIRQDGSARYLTVWEVLVWKVLHKMPV